MRSRSSYYGRPWRKLRITLLNNEPLCRICGQPANEVDHIVAVDAGGTDDPSNLQPLCRSCHAAKTRAEHQHPQASGTLRVVVVWGPPASGKTTYINTHKRDGDVVLDLDALIAAIGGDRHWVRTPHWWRIAWDLFHDATRATLTYTPERQTVWIQSGNELSFEADNYGRPIEVSSVRIEASPATCIKQAMQRGASYDSSREIVEKWFKTLRVSAKS